MQPDLAKCDYQECELKDKCQRFHSKHSGIINFKSLKNVDGECDWFEEIKMPITDNSNDNTDT